MDDKEGSHSPPSQLITAMLHSTGVALTRYMRSFSKKSEDLVPTAGRCREPQQHMRIL